MAKKLKKLSQEQKLSIHNLIAKAENPTRITKSYHISIVTPMYGGGATANEIDKKHPIRSSSIRGNLRFWWRATRGALCKDVNELFERESEVFGNTTKASPTKIWVDSFKKLNSNQKDAVNPPRYVIAQFLKGEKYIYRYEFRLNIETDETIFYQELLPALWAWINFGGIGKRTRRGCGSLYCPSFSPNVGAKDLQDWFQSKCKEYGLKLPIEEEYRNWPVLRGCIIQSWKKEQLIYSWTNVIKVYKQFRSRANLEQGNPRRRSPWPEADSIRHLTEKASPRHSESATLKDKSKVAFPRAQLGLPIEFRFKDEREVPDMELRPKSKERLASPLILKTLAVSKTEGYGIIASLSHPRLDKLELTFKNKKPIPIRAEQVYTSSEYRNESINPMVDGKEKMTSAIEAFIRSSGVRKWKKN